MPPPTTVVIEHIVDRWPSRSQREQAKSELAALRAQLDAALSAPSSLATPPSGIELIAAERERQQALEGWSPEHDDLHDKGQMAISAARYALEDIGVFPHRGPAARYTLKELWQWESCWWKPKDPIRNLARAGALIAAEIDRRLRSDPPSSPLPSETTTDD